MDTLLGQVLEAHGGLERWQRYSKVEATIVTGGGLFPLKGVLQDRNPRRMTVWLHEERSSVTPYGAPDQRTMFTPERIAIEKLDGMVVAQRYAPRDSFAGHQMHTPWDPLHSSPLRRILRIFGTTYRLTKQVRLALADSEYCARKTASQNQERLVAKRAKKRTVRPYTKTEEKELRAHSKAKTPVARISKLTKRSVAALRKKAGEMGLPLGHRR